MFAYNNLIDYSENEVEADDSDNDTTVERLNMDSESSKEEEVPLKQRVLTRMAKRSEKDKSFCLA